ncbi:MAG: outer membrane protein assembly factor BamE domain-containing protein [Usitatibacter sp.]
MDKRVCLAAALLLCACASYDGGSLRPGVSSESDVRSLMGAPRNEFTAPDGTRGLVYPKGPLGTQTFIVTLGQDGRVREVRQVLKDDTFYRIHPGMTEDEILQMIGPPGETMSFARSNTHAWDYRYIDTWGSLAIFSVTFDANGRVVSKFTRRIEKDAGRH